MNWKAWIRACVKDPNSPINLPRVPRPLAPLTGQDTRTLDAIVACWELYFSGDYDAEHGALAAVRALLPALQPSTRVFARELIPFCGDWDHREKIWPLVTAAGELEAKPRRGRPLPPPGSYFCPKCETDRRLSEPCIHIQVAGDVRPILCEIGTHAEATAKQRRMQVIIPEGAPPGHYTVIPPFEFPDDDEPVKAALLEVADALSVRADERNTVEEIKRRCVEQGRAFADVAWQSRQAVRVSNTNETGGAAETEYGRAARPAVHVCTDPRCRFCERGRRH